MASKSSLKPKETGQPNNFREYLIGYTHNKFFDWIGRHIKFIGLGVGIIILVILIGLGWTTYKESLNKKAIVLEGKAFKLHQEIQTDASSQTTDSSNTDTTEAQNPYQEVLGLYQEIVDRYPRTESAARALYLLGSIEYERGNYEQAQQYFSTYISKYPQGELLTDAEKGIGYIFEQQQQYQQALETFTRLENSASSAQKVEILLAIARNYEILEEFDQAVATYQRIVDSSTSFSLKNKAIERLAILQIGQEEASVEEVQETTSEEQNSETKTTE